MKTSFNLKNLIRDYLNGRLSESDRQRFIKSFDALSRSDPEQGAALFDQIHAQIEALSEQELQALTRLLRARADDTPVHSLRKTARRARSGPLSFMRIRWAAVVLLLGSIGLFIFWYVSAPRDKTYFAKTSGQLIWLQDSSSVYLSAGSRLTVEADYGEAARHVILDGSGLFEVQPDKQKPFLVKGIKGFYTRVLGTSFKISTSLQGHQVEVLTGRVEVGEAARRLTVLTAGDKFQLSRDGEVSIEHYAEKATPATLQFTRQTLGEIITRLAKAYDTPVRISEENLKNLRYTATFSSEQPLEEIISVLCALHDLSYTKVNNQIIITKP